LIYDQKQYVTHSAKFCDTYTAVYVLQDTTEKNLST